MSTRRPVSWTALVLPLFALAGCGGSSPPPASQTPPTTLTGNWSLTGSRTPQVLPFISSTLFVSGKQISGTVFVQLQCSQTAEFGLEAQIAGAIAEDGSFTATLQPENGIAPDSTGTLSGNSPAANSQSWTGSFAFTLDFASHPNIPSCSTTQSGTLTARAIPPFNGTYTGSTDTSSPPTGGIGSDVGVTLQVTQGEPVPVTSPISTGYQLPLSATIALTGSSCFTSGSTVTSPLSSQIVGDQFAMEFLMNDGSNLFVSGNFDNLSETSFKGFMLVFGGACNHDSAVTRFTLK